MYLFYVCHYDVIYDVGVGARSEMDNSEKRAVIKFFVKEGLKPKEIYEKMLKTLGNDCPSLSTVRKWEFLFKRGRLSMEDDPRAGAPKYATNDENIDAVHSIVMNDRRVTVTHIAETKHQFCLNLAIIKYRITYEKIVGALGTQNVNSGSDAYACSSFKAIIG